jgi:2-polyprenyl-3-methyl-5-hydroxy-6-metoxy-1,4-benzoquinol methylase
LAGQALPHEPQWLGLLASATHPPAQAVMPEGHVVVHTPLAHTWPVAQVLPQAPQLSGSLESDTHVLEQFVCSDEQWAWHLP